MSTTPSATLQFTSTTASDRPKSEQDQPQVDATRRGCAAGERALVLHGGGSAGNAWEIGVVAGLFDAGLDVTEADLIIVRENLRSFENDFRSARTRLNSPLGIQPLG